MSSTIILGDCREVLKTLEANSVDAIVTDPPYDLTGVSRNGSPRINNSDSPAGRHHLQSKDFMGMAWDGTGVAFDPETWLACKRVLAPGGYLLAFGGTRTYHRMAVAIEDAGFEIKDCLSWLYGSGFPKHKTLLKPAWEPIVLAKKRGAGTLNVDACRIETVDILSFGSRDIGTNGIYGDMPKERQTPGKQHSLGRWPANVVLDEEAAAALDASVAPSQSRIGKPRSARSSGEGWGNSLRHTGAEYEDEGGASRYFYTAKSSRAERDKGLEGTEKRQVGMISETSGQHVTRRDGGEPKPAHNDHPTVKPTALMQWLVRLVTPPGGVVLDPFMGSGSTGIAADREGFNFIGIEQNERYAEIARLRLIGDAPMFADVVAS